MSNIDDRKGKIITFYSYKGGTGRSMALANIACLFGRDVQRSGLRILVIDWDLEAPGLHHFLLSDMENQREVETPGLIDYFTDLSGMVRKKSGLLDKLQSRHGYKTLDEMLPLAKYTVTAVRKGFDLIKAGRFRANYASTVVSFDWEKFFKQELFNVFRDLIMSRYDYCLIDSRTGLNDISGMSAMVMPEKLVLVFTPNRQSVDGITSFVNYAIKYRKESNDFRPLSIFPLPSRIELSQDQQEFKWRDIYRERFEQAFSDAYQRSVEACSLASYFETVQLPQVGYCAYGENIVVLHDHDETMPLKRAYEAFYDRLVNLYFPWDPIASSLNNSSESNSYAIVVSMPHPPAFPAAPIVNTTSDVALHLPQQAELQDDAIKRHNSLAVHGDVQGNLNITNVVNLHQDNSSRDVLQHSVKIGSAQQGDLVQTSSTEIPNLSVTERSVTVTLQPIRVGDTIKIVWSSSLLNTQVVSIFPYDTALWHAVLAQLESKRLGATQWQNAVGPQEKWHPSKLGLSQDMSVSDFSSRVGRILYDNLTLDLDAAKLLRAIRTYATDKRLPVEYNLILPDDVLDLGQIPWELMHDEQGFLLLHHRKPSSLIRCSRRPEPIYLPISTKGSLHILVILPYAFGSNTENVRNMFMASLNELARRANIEIELFFPATIPRLRDRIHSGPPVNIIHFIGGGRYVDGMGELCFDGANGEECWVPARLLATLLADTQLAVLIAQQSNHISANAPRSGVGPALSAAGVPAVVGMQCASISVDGAIQFFHTLYQSLAQGDSLQWAISQARHDLYINDNPDWYAPTVIIRGRQQD